MCSEPAIAVDLAQHGGHRRGRGFCAAYAHAAARIAGLSDEEVLAGLPDAVVSLIPGDAARGVDLTVPHNCISCHVTDNSLVEVAPTWSEIADTAVGRAQQLGLAGPAMYLYDSITNPNDFIVDGYNSDVMPETYAEELSDQDFADLLTYLLSLRAE